MFLNGTKYMENQLFTVILTTSCDDSPRLKTSQRCAITFRSGMYGGGGGEFHDSHIASFKQFFNNLGSRYTTYFLLESNVFPQRKFGKLLPKRRKVDNSKTTEV